MNDHSYQNKIKKMIDEGTQTMGVVGLTGSARSFLLAKVLEDLKRPSLIILSDKKESEKLFRELQFFMPGSATNDASEIFMSSVSDDVQKHRLFDFPPYDLTPLSGLSPHKDIIVRRLRALYAMLSLENPIVVTSIEAISYKILPKDALVKSIDYVEVGEEFDRDSFLLGLESKGYQRSSLVEEIGDYAVRGGVIDIFSTLYPLPIRLEFWGDRLESIRAFDPGSQRSKGQYDEMVLLPCREIMMDGVNMKRARTMGRLPRQSGNTMGFAGQEAWLNHFYPDLHTVLTYFPPNGLIILQDSHRLQGASRKLQGKVIDDVDRFRNEAAKNSKPFPDTDGIHVTFKEIELEIRARQKLEFGEMGLKDIMRDNVEIKGHFQSNKALMLQLAGRGRVSMAPLANRISEWLESRGRVVIITRTDQQAKRLMELLQSYDITVDHIVTAWGELPRGTGVCICLGRLSNGFSWPELGLLVISEDEIFGARKGRSLVKRSQDSPLTWSSFAQLKTGDFVVHEEHGIGQYGGLSKLEIAHKVNEFVIIEYADKDRLYVPADRISTLQKYAGAQERDPKLDHLGGHSWSLIKQKAKKSVRRIAKQLINLYALRKYRKGYAFSPPDHVFREFEGAFSYEETQDQAKAIEDVLGDMVSDMPMDRLICGDVGFGKTEVAVRAAFKAVSDGKQVAVLVPTTVLAEQHYETFKMRIAPYSMKVGMLSRFKTKAEQSITLGELRSGKIDIIIGTHRLLQKDVDFRDLGLLIVDEEQRFGVKQKELLKKYRSLMDVLAITATPIPRTFQMSMMGVRDLSIIETPPENRLAIKTYLSAFDESLIKRAISFELERGGQMFFVHNRVRTIDLMADRLKQLAPQARFAVAHGQMREKELERTMLRFLNNEIDVLVCSTIIESGLDIPSANTIIINEADRLGLAQIYQLRGRVGRSKEEAYAYLFVSNQSELTRDAEKRLKALMDFSHLGAGLHLAMHDLKIRGGGNILGFSQAGHISAVGYELYLKLIERAIAELKGEEWHEEINPEINADLPSYLPGDYIPDTDVRLNVYRRLSSLNKRSELEGMKEEIIDRFGELPPEASNLIGMMSIRLLLKKIGISRLEIGNEGLSLTFSTKRDMDHKKLIHVVSNSPGRFHFLSQNKLRIRMRSLLLPDEFSKIEKMIKIFDFDQTLEIVDENVSI